MEPSNVTHIPIKQHPPANDAAPGPLRFAIPKDVLDNADARDRAGLATRPLALPQPGETINVLIDWNCGYRPEHLGSIKLATCKLAIDAKRILVDFTYGEADTGTKSAWVTLSQITFPKRNADCGVV